MLELSSMIFSLIKDKKERHQLTERREEEGERGFFTSYPSF